MTRSNIKPLRDFVLWLHFFKQKEWLSPSIHKLESKRIYPGLSDERAKSRNQMVKIRHLMTNRSTKQSSCVLPAEADENHAQRNQTRANQFLSPVLLFKADDPVKG
jgi:hypothetical protein